MTKLENCLNVENVVDGKLSQEEIDKIFNNSLVVKIRRTQDECQKYTRKIKEIRGGK